MKINQLVFEEFNLDGKAGDNTARGIKAYSNNLLVFFMEYVPKEKAEKRKPYFYIQNMIFPFSVYKRDEHNKVTHITFPFEAHGTIEEAKEHCQEVFEMYMALFTNREDEREDELDAKAEDFKRD